MTNPAELEHTPEPVRLFQLGDFTLASGAQSRWKIECDALGPDEWSALALMLSERLPRPFEWVYGVPRGGLPLQTALEPHVTGGAGRALVVDDVWTTGGSMRRHIAELALDPTVPVDTAVVFARNPTPASVTALFTMAIEP